MRWDLGCAQYGGGGKKLGSNEVMGGIEANNMAELIPCLRWRKSSVLPPKLEFSLKEKTEV